MTQFTPTQGRYLSFIQAYIDLHGYPPAESDIAKAMCVSPPSVNQMVKILEKKGLILRQPGQARSVEVMVPADEIPPWNKRKATTHPAPRRSPPVATWAPAPTSANLYVLSVFLMGGPSARNLPASQSNE